MQLHCPLMQASPASHLGPPPHVQLPPLQVSTPSSDLQAPAVPHPQVPSSKHTSAPAPQSTQVAPATPQLFTDSSWQVPCSQQPWHPMQRGTSAPSMVTLDLLGRYLDTHRPLAPSVGCEVSQRLRASSQSASFSQGASGVGQAARQHRNKSSSPAAWGAHLVRSSSASGCRGTHSSSLRRSVASDVARR